MLLNRKVRPRASSRGMIIYKIGYPEILMKPLISGAALRKSDR